jgi:hypothetical protein
MKLEDMSDEQLLAHMNLLYESASDMSDQLVAIARQVLLDYSSIRKPVDRNDWPAVDAKIAGLMLLQHREENEYRSFMMGALKTGLTAEGSEKLLRMTIFYNALSHILMTHATFMVRCVYRDGNADWYIDRLFAAVEEAIRQDEGKRRQELEEHRAKVRRAYRQAAEQGCGDSESGEGGQRPEARAGKTGNKTTKGVRQRRH